MGRLLDAAQPCLFRVRRKAFNAAVTMAPMVKPAFRMFAEKFYGPWWKLQSDRNGDLWNFDGATELGGFLEIAIGLTLGKIELA